MDYPTVFYLIYTKEIQYYPESQVNHINEDSLIRTAEFSDNGNTVTFSHEEDDLCDEIKDPKPCVQHITFKRK